eukprot:364001-Chlamydomonas_euryale.AAC.5
MAVGVLFGCGGGGAVYARAAQRIIEQVRCAMHTGTFIIYCIDCICMRGPERLPRVKPRRGSPRTKHVSRPQVEAFHACRG